MVKNTNTIIVATPFSLLCAHELVLKCGSGDSKYIYLSKSNNKNNTRQIISVAKQLGIQVEMPFSSISCHKTLKHLLSIFYLALFVLFNRFGTVIVGHWSSTYSRIILSYGSKSMSKWVVDDGAVTVKYPEILPRKAWENEAFNISKDFAAYLRTKVFNVDFRRINLFTFYNGAINPIYPLFQNRLELTASRFKSNGRTNVAIFVGSPFVGAGVTKPQYVRMINACLKEAKKEISKDMRIIYFAHRREVENQLLYEIFDEVVYASLPLELELMVSEDFSPSIIMGFHSSAIYHCSEIFDIKGISFWPKDIFKYAEDIKISYSHEDTITMPSQMEYMASLFNKVEAIVFD